MSRPKAARFSVHPPSGGLDGDEIDRLAVVRAPRTEVCQFRFEVLEPVTEAALAKHQLNKASVDYQILYRGRQQPTRPLGVVDAFVNIWSQKIVGDHATSLSGSPAWLPQKIHLPFRRTSPSARLSRRWKSSSLRMFG